MQNCFGYFESYCHTKQDFKHHFDTCSVLAFFEDFCGQCNTALAVCDAFHPSAQAALSAKALHAKCQQKALHWRTSDALPVMEATAGLSQIQHIAASNLHYLLTHQVRCCMPSSRHREFHTPDQSSKHTIINFELIQNADGPSLPCKMQQRSCTQKSKAAVSKIGPQAECKVSAVVDVKQST